MYVTRKNKISSRLQALTLSQVVVVDGLAPRPVLPA
jgi:hypothetical protein